MNLEDLRKSWEKGLELVCEAPNVEIADIVVFVVLLNPKNKKYSCHRYIKMGSNGWDVSVDARDVEIKNVIAWAFNQKVYKNAMEGSSDCKSCDGCGYFDSHNMPTLDRNGRQCLDCRGTGG